MSQLAFQGKVTLVSAYQPTPGVDPWECVLQFADNEGVFTGLNISVGDVVVFDTGGYETGTFTFYTITSVPTPDGYQPTVLLEYMNVNDNTAGAPDLGGYIVGAEGTISRPSTNLGLLPVISRDAQLLSDRFTEYVQNYNFVKIVDNLQAGDKTFTKINSASALLLKGMAVYINDTQCIAGLATSYATSHIAGVVADPAVPLGSVAAISSKGMIEKLATEWDIITGETGGLIGGRDYFLRDDLVGGLSSTPPSADGSCVVKVGKAISPTVLDINIEPPIQL